MTVHLTDDPEVAERVSEMIDAARAAGYERPLYGALVIAVAALVGVERKMPAGRHPEGKASGGV